MAMYSRLLASQVRKQLSGLSCNSTPWGSNMIVRGVFLTPSASAAARKKKVLDYDQRNAAIGRPMSPHLTIYAPQLTAMMSITHRITGMGLFTYVTMFGMSALIMSEEFNYYAQIMDDWGTIPIWLIKFLIAAPFSYHYCNALRHLAWDFGMFLSLKEVYSTGYVTMGITALFLLGLLAL